jgi:hypothetical protein
MKKSPYIWTSGGVGNTIGAIVNELNDRVQKLYEDFIKWINNLFNYLKNFHIFYVMEQ